MTRNIWSFCSSCNEQRHQHKRCYAYTVRRMGASQHIKESLDAKFYCKLLKHLLYIFNIKYALPYSKTKVTFDCSIPSQCNPLFMRCRKVYSEILKFSFFTCKLKHLLLYCDESYCAARHELMWIAPLPCTAIHIVLHEVWKSLMWSLKFSCFPCLILVVFDFNV